MLRLLLFYACLLGCNIGLKSSQNIILDLFLFFVMFKWIWLWGLGFRFLFLINEALFCKLV